MPRFLKSRSAKKGLPPGSLTYIAEEKYDVAKITLINYTDSAFERREVAAVEECLESTRDPDQTTWVDIQGLSDTKMIEQIGKLFGIHRLWLEDVLNTDHRPKLEELDDLVFVLAKYPTLKKKKYLHVHFEQISLFLGPSFVITFQEQSGDTLNRVKSRLEKSVGRIRSQKAPYLFYSLIDSIVDEYFSVLEKVGSEIEACEELLEKRITSSLIDRLYKVKKELLYIRKSALPLKETLIAICKRPVGDIDPTTAIYFTDALDHAVQIVDVIHDYKEMVMELILKTQNQMNLKMNEIMAFLTIFASIFIPLNFLVGVYGMNFENMPELRWRYGYPLVWAIIIVISLTMLFFFKKRKWI